MTRESTRRKCRLDESDKLKTHQLTKLQGLIDQQENNTE